jgi:hypothetical protein
MRIIIEKRILKTFDEFSKEDQEKIIEKYRDINDFQDYGYIIDNYSTELLEYGIDFKDILYAYGYREWHAKIAVSKIDLNIDVDLLPQYLGYGYIAHLGGGMMTAGSTQLEMYKGKNKKKLENIIEILQNIAIELKTTVDYDFSDEAIIETIKSNEYEFYTDNLKIV